MFSTIFRVFVHFSSFCLFFLLSSYFKSFSFFKIISADFFHQSSTFFSDFHYFFQCYQYFSINLARVSHIFHQSRSFSHIFIGRAFLFTIFSSTRLRFSDNFIIFRHFFSQSNLFYLSFLHFFMNFVKFSSHSVPFSNISLYFSSFSWPSRHLN